MFQKNQAILLDIANKMKAEKVCRISRIEEMIPFFEDTSMKYQKILKQMKLANVYLVTEKVTSFDGYCRLYFHFDNWNTTYSGSYGVIYSEKDNFEPIYDSVVDFENKTDSSINALPAAKNWYFFKEYPLVR
jgi:hypothetical protein